MNELEEGSELRLDFGKLAKVAAAGADVLPVAVQHADTGEVILVAYANAEALRTAIARRTATFWSTSRNELWVKGATSGHVQHVREVYVDCDADCVLLKVEQVGGIACHTGAPHCFFRRVDPATGAWQTVDGAPTSKRA
jgi:phosphoribosyl-AMP cyclohydrolase